MSQNRFKRLLPKTKLPRVAASLLLGLASVAAAVAEPVELDPVYVYYPRGSCRGSQIEIEVWEREAKRWRPHAQHARIDVDTCQLEDAGILLNEIRRRCVEPAGEGLAPAWLVGVDVFDPGIMERCVTGNGHGSAGGAEIVLTRGGPGEVVRSRNKRLTIEGQVQPDGSPAGSYDVVIAIDRSASTRAGQLDLLSAQIDAARSFVRAQRARLGAVRVGLVAHPNMPPQRGSLGGTAARRVIALSDDYAAIMAALDRLQAGGASGFPSLMPAFDFAFEELLRPGIARGSVKRELLFAFDGRSDALLGPEAQQDPALPAFVARQAARAQRRGVSLHLFAMAGLAAETPVFLREAFEAQGGGVSRILRGALAMPFFQRVSLPHVRSVRVANLSMAPDLASASLAADGRFELALAAVSGTNRMLAVAELSDGRKIERQWELSFDDGLIREALQAEEAERIRRLRERRVVIEAEESAPR